jgi:hypothetical protein
MNDSNLNFVLLQMTSKPIIVMEDLDWFLTNKSTAVSLFVDVRIHFSLCDFLAFKTLANSYLGFKDHKFFSQVNDIFQSRESLNSPSRAIKSIIIALQTEGDRRCQEGRVAVGK